MLNPLWLPWWNQADFPFRNLYPLNGFPSEIHVKPCFLSRFAGCGGAASGSYDDCDDADGSLKGNTPSLDPRTRWVAMCVVPPKSRQIVILSHQIMSSSTRGIQAGAPKSLKHNSPCSFSLWRLEIPRHMEILQWILDDMPWMCGGCNSYLQTVYVSFFMMLNDIILGMRWIPGISPRGDWKLRFSDLCALEMMEFHCHFNVRGGIKTGYYCRQTPALFS